MDTERHSWAAQATTIVLAAVLLTLAPFGTALEIHHALAAADHDGHQHSDNDLCQWVQYHTGSSLTADPPILHSLHRPQHYLTGPVLTLLSANLVGRSLSRGPPPF